MIKYYSTLNLSKIKTTLLNNKNTYNQKNKRIFYNIRNNLFIFLTRKYCLLFL